MSTNLKKSLALKGGYSLIEVVLAIAIATICFLAVYGLLSVALVQNQTTSAQAQATRIISTILADIRSSPAKTSGNYSTIRYQIQMPALVPPPGTTTGGSTSGVTSSLYFDINGDQTNATGAIYVATIVATPPPVYQPLAVTIRCSITWPPAMYNHVESTSVVDFN